MKKITLLITTLVILLISSTNATAEEETTNIVCTNSALADFTSNIITENVTISYIMPGGSCPAHFDISPSQVSEIIEADIIISLGWEPWLTNISDKLVDINQQQIKCTGFGEWNLPQNAIKFVEKIRDELIILLPEQNDSIFDNAQNYINEINQTEGYIKKMIKSMNYENRQVIAMEWQMEFIEMLGFDVVTFYGPPEGLSTQDKLNITDIAISNEIVAIVDNLQSGTDFGGQIAEDAKTSHVVFTNFPGAIDNVDTYLEMIEYNTAEIIKGVTNYDYIKENPNLFDSSNVELQRNTAIVAALICIIIAVILFLMYKRK